MQRHFFATAEDLFTVFDRVEAKRDLAYTLTGLFTSSTLTTVHSGAAIPTLSKPAPEAGAINGYGYLVTPLTEPVVVRKVMQRRGGVLYAVDQLANPLSVIITPGGLYPPNVHLSGRIGTVSNAEFATQLYRAFASAFGRLFLRVHSFYLGPQAEASWRGGMRMTSDAGSPPEYDLAPPGHRPAN